MSAGIVFLCNARHNGWRWAICITLCNHRNVYNFWVLRLYMSSYSMYLSVLAYFIVHAFGLSVMASL